MKHPLRSIALSLIGLGFTLSIFDFLLENSFAVLLAGGVLLGVSYLVKK